MDPGLAECFTAAAREVFGEVGLEVTRLDTNTSVDVRHGERSVIATVGLVGDLNGSLLLHLSAATALQVVASMYRSLGLDDHDPREVTETAIAELTNQIAGRAITNLSRRSLECDMTPPAVITGSEITSAFPGLASGSGHTLEGAFGRVLILVGLRG